MKPEIKIGLIIGLCGLLSSVHGSIFRTAVQKFTVAGLSTQVIDQVQSVPRQMEVLKALACSKNWDKKFEKNCNKWVGIAATVCAGIGCAVMIDQEQQARDKRMQIIVEEQRLHARLEAIGLKIAEFKVMLSDIQSYPEPAKFVERYTMPDVFKQKIENCKMDPQCNEGLNDANWWHGPRDVKGLQGIYLKGSDIARIIHALRMQRCIEKYGFQHVAVAKKYIGKIDGQWEVIAQKITGDDVIVLTLAVVKELIAFILVTGFSDWKGSNFLWDEKQQKLTIIDTEDRSFNSWVGLHQLLNYQGVNMELDALEHLRKVIEDLKYDSSAIVDVDLWGNASYYPVCSNLTKVTVYDDVDINFESVKKFFTPPI